MYGDCHIHMILDGVYYKSAIDHQKGSPDVRLIRERLSNYRKRGVTFLRDGGDAWGIGYFASRIAQEYDITYRTPIFPICRKGHYGEFIGRSFSDLKEYKALVREVKDCGGHFIKIMVSGLMDFNEFGKLTDTPCSLELTRDLIAIAHDEGFAVMAHANGTEAISNALSAGVDSIEHGAYMDRDTLHQLAESGAIWVPTLSAYGNLIGEGRFPDDTVKALTAFQQENVAYAASIGALVAAGSDAGAYAVYHVQGAEDEVRLMREALGDQTDRILTAGENAIRHRF